MTTAYVIQVTTDKGVRYVNSAARLGRAPKFFTQPSVVKHYLRGGRRSYGTSSHYDQSMQPQTIVIITKNLEKGLKDSVATTMTPPQFIAADHSVKAKRSNPDAIYKLRLANGKFVGAERIKFGRVWQTAGQLRSHITTRSYARSNNIIDAHYKDAVVVEIAMNPDQVTTQTVKEIPIREFYLASSSSRARYTPPPVAAPFSQFSDVGSRGGVYHPLTA